MKIIVSNPTNIPNPTITCIDLATLLGLPVLLLQTLSDHESGARRVVVTADGEVTPDHLAVLEELFGGSAEVSA